MKSKTKRGVLLFTAGFIALFLIRIAYCLLNPPGSTGMHDNLVNITAAPQLNSSNAQSDVRKGKQNIASSKMVVTSDQSSKTVTVDQKYERIALISSTSQQFEKDSSDIRSIIKAESAVIQFENNTGIKGGRFLELSIGIHPDKFDTFVEKLKGVGKLIDFKVEKIDKTSEYKDLKARQATLEKTRNSLAGLKEKGGNINELVNLEKQILEIEEQIQNYGVQLGDFNEENELCTVKITLREVKGVSRENIYTLSFIVRTAVDGFTWALQYYLGFLVLLALAGICSYIILIVVDKSRDIYASLFKEKHEKSA